MENSEYQPGYGDRDPGADGGRQAAFLERGIEGEGQTDRRGFWADFPHLTGSL